MFGESESRSVVSDSLWPHGLHSPCNSPGQDTGLGCHSLRQGIFPTQGLNPGLPHCRWTLYQLSYQGSPGVWKDSVKLGASWRDPFSLAGPLLWIAARGKPSLGTGRPAGQCCFSWFAGVWPKWICSIKKYRFEIETLSRSPWGRSTSLDKSVKWGREAQDPGSEDQVLGEVSLDLSSL